MNKIVNAKKKGKWNGRLEREQTGDFSKMASNVNKGRVGARWVKQKTKENKILKKDVKKNETGDLKKQTGEFSKMTGNVNKGRVRERWVKQE